MTSANRLSARGLEQLGSQLTERDRAVLADVDRYRLMTGRQLQRLHFGNSTAHARAAARLLLRLTHHNLLARLPRTIGGVRAGSTAFVFALGPTGRRLLHGDTPRGRRVEVSDGFLHHTLAITELYVQLREAAMTGQMELLSVTSEPSCWRPVPSLGGVEWLKPDLHAVVAVEDIEWHSWVELDMGTEHTPALRRKLALYEAAYRSGQIAAQDGVFPRVVWLVPTPERAAFLARVIREAPVTGDLHAVALQNEALSVLTCSAAPPASEDVDPVTERRRDV